MSNQRTQVTVRISEEVKQKMELAIPCSSCKNQNEFINEAVKFYSAYLCSEDGIRALYPDLMREWQASLQAGENRMGSLLFKIAVEMNMMANLVSARMAVTDDDMKLLRSRCVREVKATKGKIALLDAMHYQNGD